MSISHVAARYREAWAEIDLDALSHNVRTMATTVAPSSVCAVVKADAYGHGAVAVAETALRSGASVLAVALVEEGLALRGAGIDAPVLLLSEPSPEAFGDLIAARITPTLYSTAGVAAAAKAAEQTGRRVGVHLKVDTGMHRVGADIDDAVALAREIDGDANLGLDGVWTHLATAEDPSDEFTGQQVARFDAVVTALRSVGIDHLTEHLANSAAAITLPQTRRSFVRSGLALYGYSPAAGLTSLDLRPVLSLKARVSYVRALEAGARPSYGRTTPLARAGDVAVVPLGYADGVPRALGAAGASVLVRGRRRRIIGNVTMDQIVVACDSTGEIDVGDEVVLIGSQDGAAISATEWAAAAGTIVYDTLCAIGPRVPRVNVGTGRR